MEVATRLSVGGVSVAPRSSLVCTGWRRTPDSSTASKYLVVDGGSGNRVQNSHDKSNLKRKVRWRLKATT